MRISCCVRASLIVVGSLSLFGCSGSTRPECHPVRGRILMGQKPVAEAVVVLHPQGERLPDVPKPIATTDAEGKFSMTTFEAGDGAPVGDYILTVELRQARMIGDELTRDGPNLLPPKYASPESSGLQISVKEGENETPPIELRK